MERLAKDKHSSLLGSFLSYKENEMLQICLQGLYSQNLIFSVCCEWAQYIWVLYQNKLERLARDKHTSLLGSFLSYEENEVL